jgi:hypothetical protein
MLTTVPAMLTTAMPGGHSCDIDHPWVCFCNRFALQFFTLKTAEQWLEKRLS